MCYFGSNYLLGNGFCLLAFTSYFDLTSFGKIEDVINFEILDNVKNDLACTTLPSYIKKSVNRYQRKVKKFRLYFTKNEIKL